MYSQYDNRGRLKVDCSECERGGNGSDKDKCVCGYKVKKPKNRGCFLGTLMTKYDKEADKIIEEIRKMRSKNHG